MKNKNSISSQLRQISIHSAPEFEDLAGSLLENLLSAVPSSYLDLRSGRSRTSVYAELTVEQAQDALAHLKCSLSQLRREGLELAGCRFTQRVVKKEDWSESWKRHFKPFVVGRRLLISPSWSRRKPERGQLGLILDPGLSFGTGHHATTRFCLEQIVAFSRAKPTGAVLDIGMGSGILALAAARLGLHPVCGFDFDPAALVTALENARLNQLEERVKFTRRDVRKLSENPGRRFDLVCANLIDSLLLEHRNRLVAQVKTGGTLVLAGILTTQFPAVQKAYESAGFRLFASREQKEWKSGAFTGR